MRTDPPWIKQHLQGWDPCRYISEGTINVLPAEKYSSKNLACDRCLSNYRFHSSPGLTTLPEIRKLQLLAEVLLSIVTIWRSSTVSLPTTVAQSQQETPLLELGVPANLFFGKNATDSRPTTNVLDIQDDEKLLAPARAEIPTGKLPYLYISIFQRIG